MTDVQPAKTAIGDVFDDKDSRMNRRVKIVERIDPVGKNIAVYCVVENISGARPLTKDTPPPSPAGVRRTIKESNLLKRFRFVPEGER